MSRIRANLITNQTADGAPTVQNGLIISGISTFQDIDVDSHTNLDNVSIAGVTTMSGALIAEGNYIEIKGSMPYLALTDTNSNPDYSVFNSNGVFSIYDGTNSANRLTISSSGNVSILKDLDVDGHTNLDNVSIAGVTTMTGNLTINSSSTAKAIVLPDNKRIYFGDGEDFWIGSNGTNGEVSGSLWLYNHLFLYDNVKLRIGHGQDLELFHNGTDSYIDNNTGNLHLDSASNIIFETGSSAERLRITSDGKLTMSSGTVELQSHMVRVGNRTTAQINAGVSTSTGAMTLDTTENKLKFYVNNEWKSVKTDFNNGTTQTLAARSAKELLDNGVTTDGVYWLNMHGAYTQANSKRHYCLMDSSYDGGGWTLLSCHNDGDGFASGTNYHFSVNVGSNPTSINDFTASNFGYDRRNTFTPAAGDQFLVRRSDNNDWRRFVVTTWSPTANSVSNGWETTNLVTGSDTGHPYWASGTVYGTGGSAESTSYAWHFNGCALAGNCANGDGGDSAAFSDYSQWAWSMNGYKGYGSSHRNAAGASLSWGTSALSEGGSLYIQIFYRKAGTQ